MGRPRKYWSQAERDEARRLQTRLNVRAHRERQKQAEAQGLYTDAAANTRQSSESSTSARSSVLGSSVARATTVFGTSEARASTTKPLPLPSSNQLLLEDGAEDSETDRIASTEDGSGNGVVVLQHDSGYPSPGNVTTLSDLLPDLPEELVMKNASLTIAGLLQDFIELTQCDLDWWPYSSVYEIDDGANDLLSSSQVAAHALCVSVRKQDRGLQNTAILAYHDAISQLQRSIDDSNVQKYAVRLLLATCMCTIYEVASIIRLEYPHADYDVQTRPLWMEHLVASGIIIKQAGPQVFSHGLGARVLMGVIPRLLWPAVRDRQSLFLDSPEWVSLLRHIPKYAIKDGVWFIAVQVPGLLQRCDEIVSAACQPGSSSSGPAANQDQLAALFQDVYQLDSELDAWLTEFTATRQYLADSPLYWPSTSVRRNITIFSPYLDFATMAVAEVMVLYWTYKLLLASIVSDLAAAVLEKVTCPLLETWREQHNPEHFAILIARSSVYWIESYAWADVLYNCFSFPLRIAAEWFKKDHEKYAEQYACCEELSKSMRTENIRYGRTTEYCLDVAFCPLGVAQRIVSTAHG